MKLTAQYYANQQEGHQTPLRIMHKIAIAHPFFTFTGPLALFSRGITVWDHMLAIVFDQVLNNQAGFGDDSGLSSVWALYRDEWRLSEGMDVFQLFGSQHVWATLVNFEFIF